MDVISNIINEARANRVMLYIRDGQLAFVAEEGRFPDELRFRIGKYREEIRRALLRGQPEEAPRAGYTPSQQSEDSTHPESEESFGLTPTIARVQEILWPVRNYDSALLFQVPAGLTQDVLLAVLQTVLDHHDMLRLQVTDENGAWKLRVRAKKSVAAAESLRRVEFAGVTGADRARVLLAESEKAQNWLDPFAGRIVRAIWFDSGRTAPGALALIINHLAMDGMSWPVLTADLKAAYESLGDEAIPNLSVKGTSYRQWSELLSVEANRPERARELSYWEQVLAKGGELLPECRLNGDTTNESGRLTIHLPASVATPLLTAVPAIFGSSSNDILLAALALAANDWRAQRGVNDRALAVDVNGHGREEIFPGVTLSSTVGWFTTLYPVRLDPGAVNAIDLARAVNAIRSQLRAAPDHGIGYGLLRYLNPETAPKLRALGRPQVSFNYMGVWGVRPSDEMPGDDWSMLSPDVFAASPRENGSEVHSLPKEPWPLEHLLFITVAAVEMMEGLKLKADIGWAARFLGENEVRSLADAWFDILRRFAALHQGDAASSPTQRFAAPAF
jgi:non-ribosomal peptide synthase protein (TIGR01720 family)